MNGTLVNDITPKQSAYLNRLLNEAVRLLDERDRITGCEWPEARREVDSMLRSVETMTRREASAAIDRARSNNDALHTELTSLGWEPGAIRRPEREQKRTAYVTEVGMYRVGERIFKVLPSRHSDRHYTKELTGFHWEDRLPVADTEGADLKFVYAKGAMALIGPEHRMPLEMEKAFGQLVGACVACGKLLTDPKSIEYGKGPVCSDNYTR